MVHSDSLPLYLNLSTIFRRSAKLRLCVRLSPHPQPPPYPKSPNRLIGGQDGGAVYFGEENPCRGGDWVPVWGLVLAGLVFG